MATCFFYMHYSFSLLTCKQKLMYALINRSPFPVEYAAPALPSLSPALDFLLDLAFRLPLLLAAVDLATNSNVRGAPAHEELVRDLACLEKMLESWLKSFGQCTGLAYENPGSSTWQQVATRLKRSQANYVYELTCEALCRSCLLLIYQGLADVYILRSPDDAGQRKVLLRTAARCGEGLYHTTALLGEVAERPVCKAVATRGPLYFLGEWYNSSLSGDDGIGAQRCAEMSASVRANAAYLHWGSVLPWSLLPLIKVPR
jgi:hypothetical protein